MFWGDVWTDLQNPTKIACDERNVHNNLTHPIQRSAHKSEHSRFKNIDYCKQRRGKHVKKQPYLFTHPKKGGSVVKKIKRDKSKTIVEWR